MRLREKGLLLIFIGLIIVQPLTYAQEQILSKDRNYEIDSLLSNLTLEEKIGQLLMVPVYSNQDEGYYKDIDYLISRYYIGGLLFFQGSPTRQAELTNLFQAKSRIRMFIGMDAEWGLAMRLDSIKPFPRNMTLGAVQDNRLIYNTGAEIARQCKIMGIHINFAPVLDVNNNPKNPVINIRSFGENPEVVSEKGIALMDGMQDNGIIAVGKHFPGHGDTDMDSHYALPVIKHNKSRLDSIELRPFRNAIRSGLKGIMVAHLNIPDLEPKTDLPASLSGKIVNDLLIHELNFKNLVFTDAMNMRGVTSKFPEGVRELEAFIAGNDILVMPVSVPAVLSVFKSAILENRITENDINERVRKVLTFKYAAGLFSEQALETGQLTDRLNLNVDDFNYRIFENAVTLLNNNNNLLPLYLTDTLQIASLSVYGDISPTFKQMVNRYAPVKHYSYLKNTLSENEYTLLLEELSRYEVVLVSIHNLNNNGRVKYGLNQNDIQFLNKLNDRTNVILTVYGNPYSLKYFENCSVLLCAYEDNHYAQETVAQQLFGAIPIQGRLPVTVSERLTEGSGIDCKSLGRLGYSSPERQGFDVKKLSLIDTIVQQSIKEKMMPGAQILIARNGRIVMEKNYGYLTYDSIQAVHDTVVYDLASVTKVAGTLQILMLLTDLGLIDLDKKLSFYLPELKNTNKEDMIIRDILAHQAGLKPYQPFWVNTTNERNGKFKYYNNNYSIDFNVEVTSGMFARPALKDSVWNWVIQSELLEKEDPQKPYEYTYSDLGFYLIQRLVENIAGSSINDFLEEYFYKPLGLKYMRFLPKKYFPIEQIAPTEVDNTFRKGIIQGNVHDEIASILGGVAGHAGLFSNAYSLAVIMQMNLQNGYYGGTQYISPDIIARFSTRQYRFNRRGMGWDKPQVIGHEYNPATYLASINSYGHSGFTGTYVWVDPDFNLVYIFLSNRTFPDASNKKLIDLEVRKRIQTVIYSSIIKN
jgi:beta-glucosidase-like glycosyl hydrolase/CubicO group peptidase (beta-lactamase class C family)